MNDTKINKDGYDTLFKLTSIDDTEMTVQKETSR